MAFQNLLTTIRACRPLVNRGGQVLDKYQYFRAFLTHNHDALNFMAEINVSQKGLFDAYRTIIASKYSARAILYRMKYGLDDSDTPMCVAGITMVNSRASGVFYTADPSQPNSSILSINAIRGLGEYLVSGEASPDYAKFIGKIKGIITDMGSFASHLASVAREFGVPAIVDTVEATNILTDGKTITMVADTTAVYSGTVGKLVEAINPVKRFIFESPIHRRMKATMIFWLNGKPIVCRAFIFIPATGAMS